MHPSDDTKAIAKREADARQPIDPSRCVCPICGYEFDQVLPLNVCPTRHYGEQEFTPDELVTSDDDYAWCI